MKMYLNAEGKRERIIPLWVNSTWTRNLWCFFKGHKNVPGNIKSTCGICCKVLNPGAEIEKLNLNEPHWSWNGEPVTWNEFCNRLEGKTSES